MKKGIGAAVAAIAMLLAGVGGASAHTTEFDSVVNVADGGFGEGNFAEAIGWVGSKENIKCDARRKVKLRVTGEGLPPLAIDSSTTSEQGGYYMFGEFPDGYDTLTVRMAKKNIGKNHHKHICTGDSAFVDGPI
jgi:hypothetical protein